MNRSIPVPTLHAVARFGAAVLLAVVTAASVAVAMQTTVLLQGRIVDEKTGQPVAAKYVIATPSGKNLKGKSSADGSFKQLLNAGESYTITINEYNLVKSVTDFSIPSADKYYEEKKDFRVRVLNSGDQLLSIAAFEKGKPALTPQALAELKKIAEMLKDNRSLEVQVTVAADELPKKAAPKAKSKKKKGQKDEAAEPAANETSVLTQARADMVRSQMEQIDSSVVKRITVVNSPSPSAGATLVVAVGEVKNRFE